MAGDAPDAHEPGMAATCCVLLHGLQGERKELRDVPLRETFADFCQRVREVTGAVHDGHDVQLVHEASVLMEAGPTPLISLDMFKSSGHHIEMTYLLKEVPSDMGTFMIPGLGQDNPLLFEFDQASFNRRRRSVEWAKDAQEAREKRLDQLVVGALLGTSEARSLCMGSRPRLAGEVADAAWGRQNASESNSGVDKAFAEEG
ncbi:Ank2 [Symbiodinium microadriaticum]|nr:Ank2 [Symbiodinium sp. KB8]CAE7858833.1 Ank2 [Symbiodinium microadriaticum]